MRFFSFRLLILIFVCVLLSSGVAASNVQVATQRVLVRAGACKRYPSHCFQLSYNRNSTKVYFLNINISFGIVQCGRNVVEHLLTRNFTQQRPERMQL